MCSVQGPFHVRFVSVAIRYMKTFKYLATCFVARYMEISMYLALCVVKGIWILHGNFHVPCHLFRKRKKIAEDT